MSLRSEIKFSIDPEGQFLLAPFLRRHPDYPYVEVRDLVQEMVENDELIPLDKSGLRFYNG